MAHPGQLLKSIRLKHRLSIRDLERLSGYSRGYIQDIESGRRVPRIFAVRCIADAVTADGKERTQLVQAFADDLMGAAC
jgi:transcriptional regulator with XRE-family HTH domain